MARTVEVHLWDDLSEPKTVEATETHTVGLDGEWSELDLSDDNVKLVVETLRGFMDRGHEPEKPPTPPRKPADDHGRMATITWWAGCRQFARENGYAVSPKGYVAKDVREKYALTAGPQPRWSNGRARA